MVAPSGTVLGTDDTAGNKINMVSSISELPAFSTTLSLELYNA